MSTSLAVASATDLVAGLTSIQESVKQTASSEGVFIKFAKGDWTFGSDGTEMEKDAEWAVNPQSFLTGFSAWGDADHGNAGVLVDERLRGLAEPPVLLGDLPEVNANWAAAAGFKMVCLSGKDADLQGSFTTTSKGGVSAISELITDVVNSLKANPTAKEVIPVVVLGTSSYKHATFGKVFIPTIEIVRWVDSEGESVKKKRKEA